MEGFKKGVDNAMPFIMLISVLLMNILLITGLMKVYFGWDSTILAGVIAFVGAVIGGVITFIGVNLTIQENRRKDDLKAIKDNIKNVDEIREKLLATFHSMYFRDSTLEQKIEVLSKNSAELLFIARFLEVFVLGNEINKSIRVLERLVHKYQIEFMSTIEGGTEETLTEIQKQIFTCLDDVNEVMDDLKNEYRELLAL